MRKSISLVKISFLFFGICMMLIPCIGNVSAASIDVNFLSAYDTAYHGSSYDITWTSYDVGDYVNIVLYYAGSYYTTITYGGTSNDGSYFWTIPSSLPTTSYYQIEVSDYYDSSVYGYSDYFYVSEGSSSYYGSSSSDESEEVCFCIVGVLIVVIVVVLSYKYNEKKKQEEKKKKEDERIKEEAERKRLEHERRRREEEEELQRKEEEHRREIKKQERKKIGELKKRIQKMKEEGYDVTELEKELDSYK